MVWYTYIAHGGDDENDRIKEEVFGKLILRPQTTIEAFTFLLFKFHIKFADVIFFLCPLRVVNKSRSHCCEKSKTRNIFHENSPQKTREPPLVETAGTRRKWKIDERRYRTADLRTL